MQNIQRFILTFSTDTILSVLRTVAVQCSAVQSGLRGFNAETLHPSVLEEPIVQCHNQQLGWMVIPVGPSGLLPPGERELC
jgi:hypothetical protein